MALALLERAHAAHRAGRLDEAEAAYRDCIDAGFAGAALQLAALLLQQGRHAEAATLLEPLAAESSGNAHLEVNLSIALRGVGRHEEARAAAERATAAAPSQVAAWNALGLAALELGRGDEALRAFERGLGLAPAHPALELHRAHALARIGRNAEARDVYARLVEAEPRLLDAWRGLARMQALFGDAPAALASRRRALELAPRRRDVAIEHAVAWLAVDADEAARLLRVLAAADEADALGWSWLGRAELRRGKLDEARDAYARAFALDPDDAVVAHYHAALAGDLPPDVESGFIRELFNDFAERFESTLLQRLDYATPAQLADLLRAHGGDAGEVLDLGCGTGLMAHELSSAGRQIDGVDLSPRMLDQARAKGLYRELHEAELVAFLRAAGRRWDWIVAADVFVYVAELGEVFEAVHARLAEDGSFAFSVERSDGAPVELVPETGRYRHGVDAVRASLDAAGFTDVAQRTAVLRLERGVPVQGELFLARRTSASPP
ncbi:MAG: tetratricopeptide repeat protein [Xanthomonadales bacterium]|nr:tetratricopeptide repeat protein [Xanthomonadales bacterium]